MRALARGRQHPTFGGSQTLRRRLARWGGIDAHPHLNMYGKPGSLESKVFTSDDGAETGRYPLSLDALLIATAEHANKRASNLRNLRIRK
jgi:hypothetical protein